MRSAQPTALNKCKAHHTNPSTSTISQDKRVIEAFRLSWDPAAYTAGNPDLSAIRRDLLQQRRWGRQVWALGKEREPVA